MNTNLFHYTDCGLDYVYLENGFEIHQTPYGRGVSIVDTEQLHKAIAQEIVSSPRPLRGQEVRFLRSQLDLSQNQLARLLGTTRVTVARWEGARTRSINGTGDTALRLAYSSIESDCLIKRTIEMLREREDVAIKNPATKRITLTSRDHEWVPAQAAA